MKRAIGIALLLVMTSCGDSGKDELRADVLRLQNDINSLDGKLAEARNAVDILRTKSEAVSSARGDLDNALQEFSNTDWAEVVPKIAEANDELETAQSSLASSVDDLDTIVAE